ncbi:MAG: hypothetical protein MI802_21925 [Desulfobacterales bacterium]|nr:hypothetical protein [Desulfobacterales bacterium]
MYDTKQYHECWTYCEYFLAHAHEGLLLNAFDLIREGISTQTSRDAYVYERLTRPVLARSAREVKGVAQKLVTEDRLGEVEIAAKGLAKRLKAGLFKTIRTRLTTRLAETFENRMLDEETPEALMMMVSLYYGAYRNRTIPGSWAHPFYFRVFLPFLVKSQKDGFRKAQEWQTALVNRFLATWDGDGSRPETLKTFFDHRTTKKVVSYAFAGILGFIRDDREKALYLFQVVNDLSVEQLALFQTQIGNGLNAALEKEKRVTPKPVKNGEVHHPPVVGIITHQQVLEIISAAVDRHMDEALDWIVQYLQAGDKKKGALAKRFDKTFLQMNRHLWQELLTLVDTQKRVLFRTRHLLRIMIHHMFEAREIERDFWQKYIPSVENIIQYTYKGSPKTLQGFSAILNRQIRKYRQTLKYQDTDWKGFYEDPKCRVIAGQVLKDIRAKAAGDGKMPALWFSSQVSQGVDDQILYRFFRQTRISA